MFHFSDEVMLVAMVMLAAVVMVFLSCAWCCKDWLSSRMADVQKNYVETECIVIPIASFGATSPISVEMPNPMSSPSWIGEENAHPVRENDGSDDFDGWEITSPGGRRSRSIRPRSGPLKWI